MFWPIVACVLLPWLLVYLGLHVVKRGIIFIDIAMAQMASLGICVAVLLRLDLDGWPAFGIALGFTLFGAAVFSLTGKRASQIPQEATIGISYVVAAATAVLLLSRAAEGDEQIKNMLVGNILLVSPTEVESAARCRLRILGTKQEALRVVLEFSKAALAAEVILGAVA